MAKRKREIAASEFKTHVLRLLDEVAETREEIYVTKRGKVVAKLVPAEEFDWSKLRGSVIYYGDIVSPLDDEVEVEK